jgi:hypothetical protein
MERRSVLKTLAAGALLPMAMDAGAQAAGSGEITPETVYELRVYHLHEGKLPLILQHFRSKETQLFTQHGMHNVAFWTPTQDAENTIKPNTLVYLLRHRSREAARASWAAFGKDPEWLALKAESEKDGPFVELHESTFLQLTDFSPKL